MKIHLEVEYHSNTHWAVQGSIEMLLRHWSQNNDFRPHTSSEASPVWMAPKQQELWAAQHITHATAARPRLQARHSDGPCRSAAAVSTSKWHAGCKHQRGRAATWLIVEKGGPPYQLMVSTRSSWRRIYFTAEVTLDSLLRLTHMCDWAISHPSLEIK